MRISPFISFLVIAVFCQYLSAEVDAVPELLSVASPLSDAAANTDTNEGDHEVVILEDSLTRDEQIGGEADHVPMKGVGMEIEIDDKELQHLLMTGQKGDVFLVKFFSENCPFSRRLDATYNALARAFPSIPVFSMDAVRYASLNYKLGVYGFPRVFLFKGNGTYRRYSGNRTIESLEAFVTKYSKIEPLAGIQVHGIIEEEPTQRDIYLILSAAYVSVVVAYHAWQAVQKWRASAARTRTANISSESVPTIGDAPHHKVE
eukprot:TRINITY_DN6375_c0_g1_i1.p1 TRINITY_DN6375_c0_g1~~TRINITY_DN6375_c0_g1_i1.p1  ORF type:complete len:261 (-),score=26.26 TRINITY_DN6375_c0_g1_i1:273-1055(-)